jgi:hypothetical protein
MPFCETMSNPSKLATTKCCKGKLSFKSPQNFTKSLKIYASPYAILIYDRTDRPQGNLSEAQLEGLSPVHGVPKLPSEPPATKL